MDTDGSRRMQAGSGRGRSTTTRSEWVKKAITRLVLVETLGGIAPPTKQFLHVFAKEAAGTATRTGRSTGRRRRAPPPSSSTTRSRSPWRRWRATPRTSTSRRAIGVKTGSTPQRVPIGSRTSKRQTASYARPQWGVPAPPSSADRLPHPSCNHVVPTIAVVGSLVM